MPILGGQMITEAKKLYLAQWRLKNPTHSKAYQAAHKEECRLQQAEYYAEHREAKLLYAAAYRAEHREEARLWRTAYYTEHREQIHARDIKYYQEHREEILSRRAGYYSEHREAIRLQRAAYQAPPPDQRRASHAKRRALKKGTSVGKVDFGFIRERDRMLCGICGKKVKSIELHFDHVIPLSKGGDHAEYNIQVAHAVCNLRKGTGRLPSQVRLPF